MGVVYWCVVGAWAACVVGGSSVPRRGVNEIEAFVKRLENEARRVEQGGVRYRIDGAADDSTKVVNLNLLPDDVIVREIEEGLDEEFAVVDGETGDKEQEKRKRKENAMESRQRSLIYRGVYLPDARFNAFVDGVMVNMVAEMKRKEMDPLYFRVLEGGVLGHVTLGPRGSTTSSSSSSSSSFLTNTTSSSRKGRQRGNAIGGGVIRGLTNVKRFGNAEIQVAGNTTLVRSHYVFGPLNLDLVFTTETGVKAVNSTLTALAAHAVTQVNSTDTNSTSSTNSSNSTTAAIDFIIDSPAPYEIQLIGAKSERYRRLSLSAMTRLFKPTGRLERRLKGTYRRARRRRVPDVTRRSGRRGRGRGGRRDSARS